MSVSFDETSSLWWSRLYHQCLDLLLPPRCAGCHRVGTWLCVDCLELLPLVEPPYCTRCGEPVANGSQLCSRCRTSPLQVSPIRSVVYYEGVVQDAVRWLKYRGRTPLAQPLGELMAKYWEKHTSPVDVVVPVPLHADRLNERGYNQAALLAFAFAGRVGLAVQEQALIRWRATGPQTDLSITQRGENVRDAFHCPDDSMAGRNVLLVDDVCTTGATLNACATALLAGGANKVQALTLARARQWRQR